MYLSSSLFVFVLALTPAALASGCNNPSGSMSSSSSYTENPAPPSQSYLSDEELVMKHWPKVQNALANSKYSPGGSIRSIRSSRKGGELVKKGFRRNNEIFSQ